MPGKRYELGSRRCLFGATFLLAWFVSASVEAQPQNYRLAAALKSAAFQGKKVITGAKDVDPVVSKIDRELEQLKKTQEQMEGIISQLRSQRDELLALRGQLSTQLIQLASDNQQRANQAFELLMQLSQQEAQRSLQQERREKSAVRYTLLTAYFIELAPRESSSHSEDVLG